MTLVTEIIIVILFWLIYGPVSVLIWQPGTSIELVAVMGAGIIFTIVFFGGILIYRQIRRVLRKKRQQEIKEEEASGEKEPETCSEEVEETSKEEVPVPHVGMLPLPIQEDSEQEEYYLD